MILDDLIVSLEGLDLKQQQQLENFWTLSREPVNGPLKTTQIATKTNAS
jgi:hypothetical protein